MDIDFDLQKGWNQLERWIRSERIGRRRYMQVVILTLILGFATILTPFLIILTLPDFDSAFLMVPIASVGIATAIVMILTYIAASIARLRDMGRSTNWFMAGLVPYLNVIFFMVLALTEGKVARDRAAKEKEKSEEAVDSSV